MQTDKVQAWQIGEGDVITLGGDVAYTVAEYSDTGEGISMTLRDDDGDVSEPFHFTPWDEIQVVTSFEDVDNEPVEV